VTQRIGSIARGLAAFEIWLVGLAVVASFVIDRALPVAVALAGLFWLIRWLAYGRPSQRTPADWAIFLLILMIPVTLWATALPEKTLPQVYRLLAGIALYYAIVNWANTLARLRWLEWALIAAGLLLAVIAPFSVQWSINKHSFFPDAVYSRFPLFVEDTVHPNVMAGSLIILLPLPLAWLLFTKERRSWPGSLLAALALLGMLAILVLTKSRGAWLALGAVLGVMVVLRWRRGWVVLAVMIFAASVVVYQLGFMPVLEALTTSSTVSTLEGRQEIWSRAIFMVQDFGFTGVGMGLFGDVADTMYPFFLASPGSVPHAHNLFLQVAVDLGIPGLIAWLTILASVSVSAWQVYRRGRVEGDRWLAALGAALVSSQVALTVHGLTDAVTWGMVKPAPLVWVLWGLAVAGLNLCVNERDSLQLEASRTVKG